MKLVGIDNVFGTDVFTPPAPGSRTLYYKGMRLPDTAMAKLRQPTPPSKILRNFLLNYDK